MRISRSFALATVLGLEAVLILLGPVLCLTYVMDIQYLLLIGWYLFITQTLPQVSVNWPMIVFGLGTGAAFCLGGHWLANRFLTPRLPAGWSWPLRWSLAGTVMLALLFTATIAVIGIVHQVAWLNRPEERMIVSSWEERRIRYACLGLTVPGEAKGFDSEVITLQKKDGAAEYLLVPRDPMRRVELGSFRCSADQFKPVGPEELLALLSQFGPPSERKVPAAVVTAPQ